MKLPLQVFNFQLTNQNNGEYDVHVDGEIVDASTQEILKSWWGDETSVSFRSFRNEVEKASPKTLNVYVNSPGGHVGDAMAMHDYLNDLEQKGTRVNRIGRGIIASAATYLVMGNNSEMSENSFMMIHNVSMVAYGDINQCENQVKAGRKFNDRIRDFYANQTGNAPETISSWMNKETWMTAAEAKERGFVKNISGSAQFTNSIEKEQWPFSNTAILNTYNSFTQNSQDMNLTEKIKAVLKNMGVAIKTEDEPKLESAAEAIANAVGEQLKPFENFEETITNAVNTAVANALKGGLTETRVTELINNSVADFVKKADITKLETDIANSLGKPATEHEVEETPAQKNTNKKRSFFNVGTFEKK